MQTLQFKATQFQVDSLLKTMGENGSTVTEHDKGVFDLEGPHDIQAEVLFSSETGDLTVNVIKKPWIVPIEHIKAEIIKHLSAVA